MGTKRLYVFLDTNVILHARPIEQIDWLAELAAEEVVLVLAITVINELDEHKNGSKGRLASKRARAFFSRFTKYEEESVGEPGAKLRDGVWLRVLPWEPKASTDPDLNPQKADDRIIGAALSFVANGELLLVARDTGILVGARAKGLRVLRLPEHLELGDEPDETERQLSTVQRELAEIKGRLPRLRVELHSGKAVGGHIALKHLRVVAPSVQDIEAAIEAERARHSGKLALPILTAPLGLTGADLEKHMKSFRAYLSQVAHVEEERGRRLCLGLLVTNEGTGPASAVEIDLFLPEGLQAARRHSGPEFPERPKLRSQFDLLVGPDRFPNLAHLMRSESVAIAEEEPEVHDAEVRYVFSNLMHNAPRRLFSFDIILPKGWSSDGFAIKAIVRTAELPKPDEITLHVRTTAVPRSALAVETREDRDDAADESTSDEE